MTNNVITVDFRTGKKKLTSEVMLPSGAHEAGLRSTQQAFDSVPPAPTAASVPPAPLTSEPPGPPEMGSETSRDVDPVSALYSEHDVSRLLAVPKETLAKWRRKGLITGTDPSLTNPESRKRRQVYYTFVDLIGVRVVRDLVKAGVSEQRVIRAAQSLKKALPNVVRPLTELRVTAHGDGIVVRDGARVYEPTTHQLLLDFEVKHLHEQVTLELFPVPVRPTTESPYTHFLRGCRLDRLLQTKEAITEYEAAVRIRPDFVPALINLSSAFAKMGQRGKAQELAERALRAAPDHPEANYNLALLEAQQNHLERAETLLRRACDGDPFFVDALVSLATVLDLRGNPESAMVRQKAQMLSPQA